MSHHAHLRPKMAQERDVSELILAIGKVNVPASSVPRVAIVIGGERPSVWVILGGGWVSIEKVKAVADVPSDVKLVLAYSDSDSFIDTLNDTISPPEAVRAGKLRAIRGSFFSREGKSLANLFKALKGAGHLDHFLQRHPGAGAATSRPATLSPGQRLALALFRQQQQQQQGGRANEPPRDTDGLLGLEIVMPVDSVIDSSPSDLPTLYTIHVTMASVPVLAAGVGSGDSSALQAVADDTRTWSLRRRYSEFSKLRDGVHRCLQQQTANSSTISIQKRLQTFPFPPKSSLRALVSSGMVVMKQQQTAEVEKEFRCERRRKGLENWLRNLLAEAMLLVSHHDGGHDSTSTTIPPISAAVELLASFLGVSGGTSSESPATTTVQPNISLPNEHSLGIGGRFVPNKSGKISKNNRRDDNGNSKGVVDGGGEVKQLQSELSRLKRKVEATDKSRRASRAWYLLVLHTAIASLVFAGTIAIGVAAVVWGPRVIDNTALQTQWVGPWVTQSSEDWVAPRAADWLARADSTVYYHLNSNFNNQLMEEEEEEEEEGTEKDSARTVSRKTFSKDTCNISNDCHRNISTSTNSHSHISSSVSVSDVVSLVYFKEMSALRTRIDLLSPANTSATTTCSSSSSIGNAQDGGDNINGNSGKFSLRIVKTDFWTASYAYEALVLFADSSWFTTWFLYFGPSPEWPLALPFPDSCTHQYPLSASPLPSSSLSELPASPPSSLVCRYASALKAIIPRMFTAGNFLCRGWILLGFILLRWSSPRAKVVLLLRRIKAFAAFGLVLAMFEWAKRSTKRRKAERRASRTTKSRPPQQQLATSTKRNKKRNKLDERGEEEMKLQLILEEEEDWDDDNAAWDEAYSLVGPFLLACILQLRGLWVKSGQYMSSRADVIPKPIVDSLQLLQDAVPSRPFEEVKRTIERDLGQPLHVLFRSVDKTALAAASIAQVHRAELPDGTQIVLKVQHQGIVSLVSEDLGNVTLMSKIAYWLDPEYDFRPLVKEFCRAVRSELDFRNEACSQRRAKRAMETLQQQQLLQQQRQQQYSAASSSSVSSSPLSSRAGERDPATRASPGFCYVPTLVGDEVDKEQQIGDGGDNQSGGETAGSDNAAAGNNKATATELAMSYNSKHVLCMEYCSGFKVTDEVQLQESGCDPAAIVKAVCEAFAYQMHVDGLFSGDPHPGNILVQPLDYLVSDKKKTTAARPFRVVLLDFGLSKTLDRPMRVAFARMTHAAATLDFGEMLTAFKAMGIGLTRFDPEEDMRNTRFIFRDGLASEQAKDNADAHMKQFFKQREDQKEKGGKRNHVSEYPQDLLFFLRTNDLLHGLASRLGLHVPYMDLLAPFAKQAIVEYNREGGGAAGGEGGPGTNSFAAAAAAAAAVGSAGSGSGDTAVTNDATRGHKDSDPPCRLPPLASPRPSFSSSSPPPQFPTLAPRLKSMMKQFTSTLTGGTDLSAQSRGVGSSSSSGGGGMLTAELSHSLLAGASQTTPTLLGCQVSVWRRGVQLCCVSEGQRGPVDPRPVTHDTLFNAFSVSKMVAAVAIHLVVQDGTLNYDTKLVDFWPEFCSQTGDGALISEGQTQDDEDGGVPFRLQQLAWKRSITVKDVLNHTAGLAGSDILPNARGSPADFKDWEACVRALEGALPSAPPGQECKYHFLTFGWLAAAIVVKATAAAAGGRVGAAGDEGGVADGSRNAFSKFVTQRIAEPLGIEHSFFLGLPPPPVQAPVKAPRPAASSSTNSSNAHTSPWHRLATLSFPLFDLLASSSGGGLGLGAGAADGDLLSALLDQHGGENGGGGGGNFGSVDADDGDDGEDEDDGDEDEDSDAGDAEGVEKSGYGNGGNENTSDSNSRGTARHSKKNKDKPNKAKPPVSMGEKLKASVKGREHLLDLRLWNHEDMRQSCCPAANGHFSADALAKFCDALCNCELLSRSTLQHCLRTVREEGTTTASNAPSAAGQVLGPNGGKGGDFLSSSMMGSSASSSVFFGQGFQIFRHHRRQPDSTRPQDCENSGTTTPLSPLQGSKSSSPAATLVSPTTISFSTATAPTPPNLAPPPPQQRQEQEEEQQERGVGSKAGALSEWSAVGHFGVGGCVAVADLANGVSVAVTTNTCLPGAKPAKELVAAVFQELNLPPLDL